MTLSAAPAKPPIAVDPSLASVVGDPAAPSGVPPLVMPPDSVPGSRSAWAALSGLYGQLRKGVKATEQHRRRYGDIAYFNYAGIPLVMVFDPDEIQKIVRNDGNVWSTGLGYESFFAGIDTSGRNLNFLTSLDFDVHRAARRLVQPAFTSSAVNGYIEIARRQFERTIPNWVTRGRVDFKTGARWLMAQVANAIFTGIEDPQQMAVIDRALTASWRFPTALVKHPRLSLTFMRGQRGYASLKECFVRLVPERRKRPGTDLFSRLCQVEDRDVSDEALVSLFVGILFAAYDTTSAAVTSMAYLLAKHPAWQERLRQEAEQLDARALDGSALQRLDNIDRAWKETLRLMPVAGALPRRALREVEIAGHRLPAGTFVTAAATAIGRNPKWWKDPLRFDPDRFSPERAEDKRHPAIFLPFGGGAHACVGMQLANIESKLLWHYLLTSCRFELLRPYEAEHTYTPLGCVSGKVSLKLTPLGSRRSIQ